MASNPNAADIQTVIETVDTAVGARFQLSHLLDAVSEARNQVCTSAKLSGGGIQSTRPQVDIFHSF